MPFKRAVFEPRPFLMAVAGAPGAGKTYSALRLATGLCSVLGGVPAVIDTEDRMGEEAGEFAFDLDVLGPPYTGRRFHERAQAAEAGGYKVLIIDNMSDEHEGEGGVLAQHDELERKSTSKAAKFSSWAEAKRDRMPLIRYLSRCRMNVILTFRASQKTRLPTEAEKRQGAKDLIAMGWTPICGLEYAYHTRLFAMLTPNCNGFPDWLSQDPGTEMVRKLPERFKGLIDPQAQLSEGMGAAMGRYLQRGGPEKSAELLSALEAIGTAATLDELASVRDRLRKQKWGRAGSRELAEAFEQATERVRNGTV